jgi:hypothetical protein
METKMAGKKTPPQSEKLRDAPLKAEASISLESKKTDFYKEVEQFIDNISSNISKILQNSQHGPAASIAQFESIMKQATDYLNTPDISESLKSKLFELQQGLMTEILPFIEIDRINRTTINKIITNLGGTDESSNIQYPPGLLDLEQRIRFINKQVDKINGCLELNTTDETLKPALTIVQGKLQEEKRILEAPQQKLKAAEAQLKATKTQLEEARKASPPPAESGPTQRPPHPLFGGGGKAEAAPDPDVPNWRKGAVSVMPGASLLAGIQGMKLKKASADPLDAAIKRAKMRGEDLIEAALAAAQTANSDPIVALTKGGQAAELKNPDIMAKVIKFTEENNLKIKDEALKAAEALGFAPMTAEIMVKQALRAKRKEAGELTDVTNVQKEHGETPEASAKPAFGLGGLKKREHASASKAPSEPQQENELQKKLRLRQEKMKATLQEGQPDAKPSSENEPPKQGPSGSKL